MLLAPQKNNVTAMRSNLKNPISKLKAIRSISTQKRNKNRSSRSFTVLVHHTHTNGKGAVNKLAKDREDPGDVLQRDAVGRVLLEFRVVELVPRENNQLGTSLALVDGPATVGYLVIHKLVEGDALHVDGLF